MKKYGLLGKSLKHSYSPQIHSMLGDYEYVLFEKKENEIAGFLEKREFDGLNVTIPYKKTVIPYLQSLSDTAKRIGSVNTIVKLPDGTLYGDNTDVYGFRELVVHSGIDVNGQKAIVLGSGGGSAAVCEALRSLGALPEVISRSDKENNYQRLSRHRDAKIAVNATPVGMYPETGISVVDVSFFPELRGVYDLIYNPAMTTFMFSAKKRGIPCFNGLYMLVAQAKKSAELFTGSAIDDSIIEEIEKKLEAQMKNVVLVGMPGSGKSTIAELLAKKTGREAIDSDKVFSDRYGMNPSDYIREHGEEAFRRGESLILNDICKLSGRVISTGGGAVTKRGNYEIIRQNGTVFWIIRDLDKLSVKGRPLSQKNGVNKLYEARKGMYELFSDFRIDNNGDAADTAKQIYGLLFGAGRQ
ncbi:MAG: AAA family ATPase [Clostridia bacterium]|nr:AAA family ATPase [Clostridia bacterium]